MHEEKTTKDISDITLTSKGGDESPPPNTVLDSYVARSCFFVQKLPLTGIIIYICTLTRILLVTVQYNNKIIKLKLGT